MNVLPVSDGCKSDSLALIANRSAVSGEKCSLVACLIWVAVPFVLMGCQSNRAESANPYGPIVEAMRQADLDSAHHALVSGAPPYLGRGVALTLFLPDDSSFQQTHADTTGALAFDWNAHAVEGHYYIHDLRHGKRLRTISGRELDVIIDREGVWVGTARILRGDIPADNAVLHVVSAFITGPRRISDPIEKSEDPDDDAVEETE